MSLINLYFYITALQYTIMAVVLFAAPQYTDKVGISSLQLQALDKLGGWPHIFKVSWSAWALAFASLLYYATTFSSGKDKVKVARVLFTLLALQSAPRFLDQFSGKPHLFSSPNYAYGHLAATVAHLVISFALSFSNGGERVSHGKKSK